ncbi:hypothetical protein B0J11DRAFT_537230 [Dendryphion nanum]|uniref:Uncharacterized protein n=1 Tax=Dendryphion nanum TaxID=256645 RepID=A0A9P9DFI2_9PLEO|nr:hypothetical protein B0J11DRAFT_537230 [Dendryphion nanum]
MGTTAMQTSSATLLYHLHLSLCSITITMVVRRTRSTYYSIVMHSIDSLNSLYFGGHLENRERERERQREGEGGRQQTERDGAKLSEVPLASSTSTPLLAVAHTSPWHGASERAGAQSRAMEFVHSTSSRGHGCGHG